MIAATAALLPDHTALNQHRLHLRDRPDLTDLAPPLAHRLLFTSLLDFLAMTAPFVRMDDLIEEVLVEVVDAALGSETCELIGSACDILGWIEPAAEDDGGRYSLRLVQYLGTILDRYGDPANPLHLVGAIQAMLDFMPEPSVIDIDFGSVAHRLSPSLFGRGHLGWTGVVCISAEPCR